MEGIVYLGVKVGISGTGTPPTFWPFMAGLESLRHHGCAILVERKVLVAQSCPFLMTQYKNHLASALEGFSR